MSCGTNDGGLGRPRRLAPCHRDLSSSRDASNLESRQLRIAIDRGPRDRPLICIPRMRRAFARSSATECQGCRMRPDRLNDEDFSSENAAYSRVRWKLIPFLFVLYVVAYLDRINVGFASLQMNRELGLSAAAFGFGAGIFFIGYFIFEIPSNLMLRRVGARIWISRIVISWGVVAMAMMLARGPKSFYLLRFLLGVAEAGFFPGIIFYLTYWFPARERARIVALFMAAAPVTGIVGNPLSGAILQWLDQVGGLSGWQWVFLLEGIPAVVLGVCALNYLTDRPEHARWLSSNDRNWLIGEMRREEKDLEQRHGLSLGQAVMDRRV